MPKLQFLATGARPTPQAGDCGQSAEAPSPRPPEVARECLDGGFDAGAGGYPGKVGEFTHSGEGNAARHSSQGSLSRRGEFGSDLIAVLVEGGERGGGVEGDFVPVGGGGGGGHLDGATIVGDGDPV